jgi:branched-chain amino acid transport system substrate-binding protein
MPAHPHSTRAAFRALAPIKIGVLLDIVFPAPDAWDPRRDVLDALELTFADAYSIGRLDRPVELILREVEGLPRGDVASVLTAYGELVDEGCLAVFGPMIAENAVVVRDAIEETWRVPALSWTAADEWHGEWTFSLSNGSMTDEPFVIANLCSNAGHRRIAVLVERSLIGSNFLGSFRQACRVEGLTIATEVRIPPSDSDVGPAVAELAASTPDAIVHLGFALGMVSVNDALAEFGWDPPRYLTTAFENGYMNDELFRAELGWVGLEQYDEGNPVGERFLDRFEEALGRRPGYFATVCSHDAANVFVRALESAEQLSPRGVMEGLERVKMLPAASGSPGTRISFGKWTRRGWMGASYLVSREVTPDFRGTIRRGRYGVAG